jgi:cytochrome c oxidase cbb3-type subunit I/II
VRTDPTLKFIATSLTFYGMATFEGPLLSIKSVNSIAHYSDWIIAHVHGGTLGWNGFLTFGMLYYLVPKLYKTDLYSKKLANAHFWIGTIGILLYIISMWTSGITQGLMWRAIDGTGHLVYPDFVETVIRIIPLYWIRALGGTLFLIGFLIMCWNFFKTIQLAPQNSQVDVYKAPKKLGLTAAPSTASPLHRRLEAMMPVFSILSFVAILVGSVIEILPTMLAHTSVEAGKTIAPYTALELAGRDIYVREGCYLCHSQMIRQMPSDVLRYGPASLVEESMYDHPFQWGSKRNGPDLARVGGKYPDLWHFRHMIDPRSVTPNSIMPNYDWLLDQKTDFAILERKFEVMRQVGVPYTAEQIQNAPQAALEQAKQIAQGLSSDAQTKDLESREVIALIAYLQRLGKNPQLFEKGGTYQ